MMEIVLEQVDRLTHLVDTMFLLSRAEANGSRLRLSRSTSTTSCPNRPGRCRSSHGSAM
jgi:hypothetical protein